MNNYLDKIGLELYHDLLQTELSHLADELNDVVIGKLIDNNFYVQENIDYVEIGGIKWATKNVGANSITDTGLYFAWGDTQGYTTAQIGNGSGQKYFGWADYKYGNGTSNPGAAGITKYNSTDNKEVLDASDDAVTAAWGGNWRMPTTQEFYALGNAGNSVWVEDYQGSGVAGLVWTDKTDSSKVLFFPAAGYCKDGSVNDVGSFGHYWSSSVYNSEKAWKPVFYFFASFGGFRVDWISNGNRYFGFPVRGVWDGDMYLIIVPSTKKLYINEIDNNIYKYDGTSYILLNQDSRISDQEILDLFGGEPIDLDDIVVGTATPDEDIEDMWEGYDPLEPEEEEELEP